MTEINVVAGMLPERGRTDREGRFVLENLPPGTYDVSASKDGFAAATQRGAVLSEASGDLPPLVLAEGVEASVRVLDAEGRPLAGAGGRLVSESGESSVLGDAGRVLTGLFAGKGVSNTKGLLELGNFAPGKYTLEVSRGGRRASRAVELSEGPPVTFTIRLE